MNPAKFQMRMSHEHGKTETSKGPGAALLQMLAPHTSPLFVSAWRLLPAGVALIAWAAATGRRQPTGGTAWLAVALFGLVDGTCFQVSSGNGLGLRQAVHQLCVANPAG